MTRSTALISLAVMLTVIPAHAAFFSFTDEMDVTQGGGARTILDTTDPNFDGIDNTFTGVVTYEFLVNFDVLDGGTAVNTFAGFQLYNDNSENLGVSDRWPSALWSYYRAAFQSGGVGDLDNGSGTLAIVTGDPQFFSVTINYVAGGNAHVFRRKWTYVLLLVVLMSSHRLYGLFLEC